MSDAIPRDYAAWRITYQSSEAAARAAHAAYIQTLDELRMSEAARIAEREARITAEADAAAQHAAAGDHLTTELKA